MKTKPFKTVIGLVIFVVLIVFFCNLIVNYSSNGKTFSQIETVPYNKVGVLLGTSKKLINGQPNLYYLYRIKAAVTLFKANKVEFILVSGDNGSIYYNEPETIKKDLVLAGIPKEKIFLDFAGFRTLDSMVRAKEVFGLEKVTVISQKFHTQRAIYIAERKGLTAVGYNAQDITGNSGLKVHIREYLARVKVFIDLVFNTQPKFYGDPIEIK